MRNNSVYSVAASLCEAWRRRYSGGTLGTAKRLQPFNFFYTVVPEESERFRPR